MLPACLEVTAESDDGVIMAVRRQFAETMVSLASLRAQYQGEIELILIDSGPSPQRLKDELGAQLPPWAVKLEAVAITAPTLGHVGGFAGFDRPARMVIVPDGQLAGAAWRSANIMVGVGSSASVVLRCRSPA